MSDQPSAAPANLNRSHQMAFLLRTSLVQAWAKACRHQAVCLQTDFLRISLAQVWVKLLHQVRASSPALATSPEQVWVNHLSPEPEQAVLALKDLVVPEVLLAEFLLMAEQAVAATQDHKA